MGQQLSMRLLAFGTAGTLLAAGLLAGPGTRHGMASNHLDAPTQILDNQMDVSDLYLFRSHDRQDTVTAICNWTAFEVPRGVAPWYEFVTRGRYEFNVDNNGDGVAEFTFRFTFKNTDGRPDPPKARGEVPGPLKGFVPWSPEDQPKSRAELLAGLSRPRSQAGLSKPLTDQTTERTERVREAVERLKAMGRVAQRTARETADYARRTAGARAQRHRYGPQSFSLDMLRPGKNPVRLATDKPVAGWGLDKRSKFTVDLAGGIKAYAGPVKDPFFWWFPTNSHTIALQLPKRLIALNRDPERNPVIGVWTNAYRGSFDLRTGRATSVQESRQGATGFSSAILPIQMRDKFHHGSSPATDYRWKEMLDWVRSGSSGALFGLVFLPLGALGPKNKGEPTGGEQLFLTGIAKNNGPIKQDLNAHTLNQDADPDIIRPCDEMRLNMAIPVNPRPALWSHGLIDGDAQGWPMGRRLQEDAFLGLLRLSFGPLGIVLRLVPLSGSAPTSDGFPYLSPPF